MAGPVRYVVKAPRTNEMVAWLQCNDIDPHGVPYSAPVFVGTDDGEKWFVQFSAYGASEASLAYEVVAEAFSADVCRVPLLDDPPMSWLLEVAPSTPDRATSAGPAGAETSTGEHTVAKCDQDAG